MRLVTRTNFEESTAAKKSTVVAVMLTAVMVMALLLAPGVRADETSSGANSGKEGAAAGAAAPRTLRSVSTTAGYEASATTSDATGNAAPAMKPSAKAKAAGAHGAKRGEERKHSHYAHSDNTTPRAELFLGYSFLRNMPTDDGNRLAWLHGGSTSLAVNINRHFGLAEDFAGFHADRFGPFSPPTGGVGGASGNVFTFLVGPRLSFRHEWATPFLQALFGGVHATDVKLDNCAGVGCTVLPAETAFAITLGGGLDITVHRHVAVRLIQAEYLMTRFKDQTSLQGNTERQNDVRLSAGLVFRFGGDDRAAEPARPVTANCSVDKSMVYAGSDELVSVRVEASDPDNGSLTYSWTASDGPVEGTGAMMRWNTAGMSVGEHSLKAHVENGRGGRAECSAELRVEVRPNRAPTVACAADKNSVTAGEVVEITATASDPDNDPLSYSWTVGTGQNMSHMDATAASVRMPTAGMAPGEYRVIGKVDDGRGGTADCAVVVAVQVAAAPPEIAQLESRLALHSIYFPTARPTVNNPDAGVVDSQQQILKSLASDFLKYLTYRPEAHLILGGHADVRGSEAYNKELTGRRVESTKHYLVAHGVAASSIEVRSFGKEDTLSAEQVKQQMQENPELSPADRHAMLNNLHVIVLANNRRVDVALSTTGQQSVRRYPFNARDAMTLISTGGSGHEMGTHKKGSKR